MPRVLVIPAKLTSDRFPSKLLESIDGLPVVTRALNTALESAIFDEVVFAFEDSELKEFCPSGVAALQVPASETPLAKALGEGVFEMISDDAELYVLLPDEIDVRAEHLRHFVQKIEEQELSTSSISVASSVALSRADLTNRNITKLVVEPGNRVAWGTRFIEPMSFSRASTVLRKQVGLFYIPRNLSREVKEALGSSCFALEKVEIAACVARQLDVNILTLEGSFRALKTPDDLPKMRSLGFELRPTSDMP